MIDNFQTLISLQEEEIYVCVYPYKRYDKVIYEGIISHRGNQFDGFSENTIRRFTDQRKGIDIYKNISDYGIYETYEEALEQTIQKALELSEKQKSNDSNN